MIKTISHLTFIVRDLERTERLLTSVLGAHKVYDSGSKNFSIAREIFFLVGDIWLAFMEGEILKERTYNHIAFKIDIADYDEYLTKIHALGLEVQKDRSRVEGEGRSIYFYDYDHCCPAILLLAPGKPLINN